MITIKRLITVIVVFAAVYLVVLGVLLSLAFPRLDPTAIAGIVGGLVGALGGILGSAMASVVAVWDRSRDAEERLKDRVSSHALELTKMDYELRQKSLELTKRRKKFLAPVKVYRELYRALLELHNTGQWPTNINELGLLAIFELGVEDSE